MSFPPSAFEDQYRFLRTHVRMYLGTSVVLETNKRVVIRCEEDLEAKALARNLHREGFSVGIRKGLKSQAWYVQALLNAPY